MIRRAILGTLLSVATTAGAANVCLQQATNQELVNELSRRLYVGGGGGGTGAQANYSCDAYGDLRLGLVGPTGEEAKADVSVRNVSLCSRQRDTLTQYRTRINGVSLVGVCDLYGDLIRFSLTTDGRLQKLSDVTIRNMDLCLKQADAMNQQ